MRGSKNLKSAIKTVETMSFAVQVIQDDIDGGVECDANRCMHKVAIGRTLSASLRTGVTDLKVRVDASGVKFHHKGFRWHAPLPRKAKTTMIQYDNPKTRNSVKPHRYTLAAIKTTKVLPFTRERQEQINQARRERAAAGLPDKAYPRSLRSRIIGLQ